MARRRMCGSRQRQAVMKRGTMGESSKEGEKYEGIFSGLWPRNGGLTALDAVGGGCKGALERAENMIVVGAGM